MQRCQTRLKCMAGMKNGNHSTNACTHTYTHTIQFQSPEMHKIIRIIRYLLYNDLTCADNRKIIILIKVRTKEW